MRWGSCCGIDLLLLSKLERRVAMIATRRSFAFYSRFGMDRSLGDYAGTVKPASIPLAA